MLILCLLLLRANPVWRGILFTNESARRLATPFLLMIQGPGWLCASRSREAVLTAIGSVYIGKRDLSPVMSRAILGQAWNPHGAMGLT